MKLKNNKGAFTPKGWRGSWKKEASVGKVWNCNRERKQEKAAIKSQLKTCHKDELNHLNLNSKDKIAKFAGIFYHGDIL